MNGRNSSRKADVSLNTIQAMYHNPHHDAVLSTLDKLAKALGVDIGDLYEVLPDEECDGSRIVRVMRGEDTQKF